MLVLVGVVLGLDLGWALSGADTGSLFYGLVDEPAHLATCAVALLLLALCGARLSSTFLAAALIASVAIDLDHAPQHLGFDFLTSGTPRPYLHCALAVLVPLVAAALLPRWRSLLLGVAFGLAAHLARDLVTGPGVPLALPFADAAVRLPYLLYAGALVAAALACLGRPGIRLAAALAFLAMLVVPAAGGAPAAAAPPTQPAVALGVYLPEVAQHPNRIDAFGRLVGRDPVIVSDYKQWDSIPFEPSELEAIWSRGAVPMITWEPLSYSGQSFPLRQIQRGRFDSYIRESARAAREWGHPILVRFAHEMNGDWYPWGRGVAGNNSYRFRAVWRRVVRLFREAGATNVQWVWTPNVNTGGELPFRDLYPGNRWVDWVGFDGFNWAQAGEWNSFTDIVDNTYEEIARISDRPMIVGETGSSDSGGDKAEWVTSALTREIPKLPRIRAVVWFDARFEGAAESGGGLDPRVSSSAEALRAFRAGIASPLYGLDRAEFLATPTDYARGPVAAPAPPSGGYGQPSFLYRLIHKLHGKYIVYAAAIALAALALLVLLTALFVRRRRRGVQS